MSEQAQNNNQQILVIGLVVIAVLLAAIVGVLIWQQSKTSVPTPTANAVTPQGSAMGQATGNTASGANGAPANGEAAAFDPKTATKVPKGTEPEAFVTGYYQAVEDGDWQAAFDALPADKKAGNTPDALKEQVTGYGIKSFKVTGATVQGDTATVKVDQVTTSYGTFENTWTLVKKDGVWLVKSKAVTGMK